MIRLKSLPFELLIWTGALTFLFFIDPHKDQGTICLLKLMGFNWCPGCGIGHSISLFMHGELQASLKMHWLGVFAFAVILHRIIILTKNYISSYKLNPETN